MASALYGKGRQAFLEGEIDFADDTIKVALVKTTHSPDIDVHDFYNDVSADVVGTPQTLASKTVVLGVADAANITYTSVSGVECSYLCIYKDTGNEATSNLIALIDTDATGLPITPNGGDITVAWHGDGIFKL